jgi:hypothetical protein
VTPFGEDPTIERLRDVLGTLRSCYCATPAAERDARRALAQAAEDVKGALVVAQSARREKELGARLRSARHALLRAAELAPWTAAAILGAAARLPRVRGYP